MKKRYTALLLLTLLLCLSGCTGKKQKTTQTTKETFDLVVGVAPDNAPYYSVNAKGEPEGIYVDQMETLARDAGFTYTFCEVEISRFADLASAGACDVFMGTYRIPTGDLTTYIQSDSFYTSDICLVSLAENKPEDDSALRREDIAAIAQTQEEVYGQKVALRYEATCVTFAGGEALRRDLSEGYSKAAVLDAQQVDVWKASGVDLCILKTSQTLHNAHCFTALSGAENVKILWDALEETP